MKRGGRRLLLPTSLGRRLGVPPTAGAERLFGHKSAHLPWIRLCCPKWVPQGSLSRSIPVLSLIIFRLPCYKHIDYIIGYTSSAGWRTWRTSNHRRLPLNPSLPTPRLPEVYTPHAWRLHWPTATHHTIIEFVECIYIVTRPFDTNKIASSGHRRTTFVRRQQRRQPNQHNRPVSSRGQQASWNGTLAAERASPSPQFAKCLKGSFESFHFNSKDLLNELFGLEFGILLYFSKFRYKSILNS